MIDLEIIRKDPQAAKICLDRRGYDLDLDLFGRLDSAKKQAQKISEDYLADRNKLADQVGLAKRQGLDVAELLAKGEAAREKSETAKELLAQKEKELFDFCCLIPNFPLAIVPDGKNSDDNVIVRQVGEPKTFDFPVRPHEEIGGALGGLDFSSAAKMSGARFAVTRGPLARMHRGLIQMMLDTHVDENGYEEVQVPYLVKPEALFGTGQLPKFEEDLFKLERDGLYLIPTAEVPVTNLIADSILKKNQLPLAFACHTPCFRREAGAAGRDVKGLIRQHQFEKVELVRVCDPADANIEFDLLLSGAESILKKLDLPYRVVALCAGDMGFSAERTFDLEVWMPAQNTWREISSVSQFGEFQSRRMKARFKDSDGKNKLLATLNGSGLAAGRALAAIMENYQQPDGSLIVPHALRRYMGEMETISPPTLHSPKKPSM